MILVALSCLQGRPQGRAFDELRALPVDGVELTPGNLPTPGCIDHVVESGAHVRFHHGFCWANYRRAIYDARGAPLGIARDHSVHPPDGGAALGFDTWLPVALAHDLLVETMYPGELLGSGSELVRALDAGLRLAVDVSHLHIQWKSGALSTAELDRVLDVPSVEEIHVSSNDGQSDRHWGIDARTYLLDWARERAADVPVVLESDWHRTPLAARLEQLASGFALLETYRGVGGRVRGARRRD